MARARVLLHACCAVCFEAVCPALADDGWDVAARFYNPNIHPYREFAKRLRALEVAADSRKIPLMADKEYGLALWLAEILPEGPPRCRACYRLRLREAAARAREGGFDAFTTTLLASGHQDHQAVWAEGEAAGAAEGVRFLYVDWRDRLESGIESARRRSLYRQQYCGCIMSEYERFGPRGEPAGEQ
jgi:hypothetical protein